MNADPATAASDIPEHFELLRGNVGFGALIGPLYLRKPREGRIYAWAFRATEKHLNPAGIVHGGMLVSFADTCLGALAFFAANRTSSSTVDLATSFVAPGRTGDWIECTGAVTRTTRDLVFLTGRVYVADRTLVDLKGIWKILRAR